MTDKEDHPDNPHEFCAILSIGDVRILSKEIVAMYEKLEERFSENDLPAYKKKCEYYKELLKTGSKHNWAKLFKEKIRMEERQRKHR